MKLVASMPVLNERGRYLGDVIEGLLAFVDEIRVLDDGSTDGSLGYLEQTAGVVVKRNAGPKWSEHEALFRRALLAHTLEAEPTHVLAIDADEIVPDGRRLRDVIEANPRRAVFTLRMVEIWRRAHPAPLMRCDGGWKPRPTPILYRVPERRRDADWTIYGPKLACGRVPRAVATQRRRALATGVDVLHLGWANPADRERRHARYAELDGGRFHARSHLDSILWPDDRCDLRPYHDPLVMREDDYPLA